MGNSSSNTAVQAPPASVNAASTAPPSESKSACPVSADARAKYFWGSSPAKPAETKPADEDGCGGSGDNGKTSECPMKERGAIYNVYNQKIDPTNQMPPPQQHISEGQRFPLPTSRVESTIPKGGTEGTWLYPSQQMFFNALKRKGKGDDVREEDIETIVSIHNNMNERTWELIREWEQMHCDTCADPKLRRFIGRVNDLTPKARMKSWLGYPIPFDRHDWYVDRCGTEVRYVIDFYHNEAKGSEDQLPTLHSREAIKSITMDARPALDSVGAFVDRVRFPFLAPSARQHNDNNSGNSNGKFVPASGPDSSSEAVQLNAKLEVVSDKCQKFRDSLEKCKGDVECSRATIAVQHCVGSVVCPTDAADFLHALETDTSGKKYAAAFEKMVACNENFQKRVEQVLTKHQKK